MVESVVGALSFGKIVGYNIMDGKNSHEVVSGGFHYLERVRRDFTPNFLLRKGIKTIFYLIFYSEKGWR